MNNKAKGSSFERVISKKLSLWWTNNEKEDVFWRTSNSGGRATVRGQKGKKTCNQHGDLCAIDPIGEPFLKMFAIEIKKGYSKHTIADLLDKPEKAADQEYEKWIKQAIASQVGSGSRYWMIIVQRNRRECLVFFPYKFCAEVCGEDTTMGGVPPSLVIDIQMKNTKHVIIGMPLESFLNRVKPVDLPC